MTEATQDKAAPEAPLSQVENALRKYSAEAFAKWGKADAFAAGYAEGRVMAPSPAAGSLEAVQRDGWRPIETAPHENRDMFIVKAFNVSGVGSGLYTSDAWAVWRTVEGGFSRWPHKFSPTHWTPLPPAPIAAAPQKGTE